MMSPTIKGDTKPAQLETVFIIEKIVAANSAVISATIGMSPPETNPFDVSIKINKIITTIFWHPTNGIVIRQIDIENPPKNSWKLP